MLFLFFSVVLLLAVFFGSVGYFICYLREEKKAEESKKSAEKFNPWSSAGRFNW